VSKSYKAILTASGGSAPYAWTVASGQLPPGLSLDRTSGQITGTPTQAGQFAATVGVSDSAGSSTSKAFALQVFELAQDQYGGLQSLPCSNGRQPHFYAQKIGSRWHLCTPAGNAFWMNGMFNASLPDYIDYQGIHSKDLVAAKYAGGDTNNSTLNWALQTVRRMKSWGFNAFAQYTSMFLLPSVVDSRWGTSDYSIPEKLPYVYLVKPSAYVFTNLNGWADGPVKDMLPAVKPGVYTGWRGTHINDFWDPNFAQFFQSYVTKDAATVQALGGPNTDYLISVDVDETDWLGGFGAGPDFPLVDNAQNRLRGGDPNPHVSWMVLVTSPVETASSVWNVVYPDTKVYSKAELSNWLSQRYGGSIASLNTAWGSRYTTFGTTATSYKGEALGAGDGVTTKFAKTLAHSAITPYTVQVKVNGTPVAGDGGDQFLYPTNSVVKSQITSYFWGSMSITFTNPPASGQTVSITYDACSPRATYTNVIGTGDGVKRTFDYGINDNPSSQPCYPTNMWPNSFKVSVAGALQGQDDGNGIINGSGIANTVVNYTSGQLSVSFLTPPAAGTSITVDYQTGGFGAGTGLMDEDGTCPAKSSTCWVTTDPFKLAGSTIQMKQDLDDFLLHHAQKYFSTATSIVHQAAPGVMISGPAPIGSWGTPPRRQILQAASQYLDILSDPNLPAACSDCTDLQQRVDFFAQYGGDKPWFSWEGYPANADSYESIYAQSTDAFKTQASRGQFYQQRMTALLNSKDSQTGTYHLVGLEWWDLYDMPNEQLNWGFMTLRDNVYDGVSSITTPGADAWGYPTGCLANFGCEQANYGNFVDAVLNANLNCFRTLASGN
jgi:Putative Ig domain